MPCSNILACRFTQFKEQGLVFCFRYIRLIIGRRRPEKLQTRKPFVHDILSYGITDRHNFISIRGYFFKTTCLIQKPAAPAGQLLNSNYSRRISC